MNDEKVNKPEDINLVDEFMKSEEFSKFFPNQIVIYRSFKFPNVVIQTIFEKDFKQYNNNPQGADITIIEYNVIVNFTNDPDYIGPMEDASTVKTIDQNDPFTLTIRSDIGNPDKKLDNDTELKYLKNFKEVFLKLIGLILENLDEKDIEKLNKDN